jgi:hypothetical protein
MSYEENDLDKIYEDADPFSGFLALPDGVYIVKVEAVTFGLTKKTKLPMISWTFKVLQGEKEGRLIFKNEVLVDPENNIDVMKMKMGILKGELKTCGITDSFKFSEFNETIAPKLENLVLKVFLKTTVKGEKSFTNVIIKEIYSGEIVNSADVDDDIGF